MSNEGVWSSSVKPPIWKSENAAGCSVSQSASAAAIFIGCASVVATPNSLPQPSWTKETGRTTMIASRAAAANTSTLRPARRCQQATPRTRKPATMRPARMAWPKAKSVKPWVMICEDVVRLGAAGRRVQLVADRVLHPRVRGDDEVGGQPRPDPDEVDRRQVHARGEPVPAEDPEADEGRLEHERADPLDRERRAEDVPDVGGERRPVHPELELHHEPGRDPDREVDDEERPEELGQAEPLLVAASGASGSASRPGAARARA